MWHSHFAIKQAESGLKQGRVLAYPTESVYGLGCLPDKAGAVMELLALKNRPMAKGLILVCGDRQQLVDYIDFGVDLNWQAVFASWPGPVTWVLPTRPGVPAYLTGAHDSLAVRVTTHPLVRALCQRVGPVVSTSANPSGKAPARTCFRAVNYFGAKVDYLPGAVLGLARPSTIRCGITGKVLR